jgi:hypoxanthine phosphoribosyltransferase
MEPITETPSSSLGIVLDAAQVQERVRELGARLDAAYAGAADLVLVGVLRGAVYFLADLSRAMTTPHRIDFVEYASYAATSKGQGRLIKRCSDSLAGADVVLVDEVLDTGETLDRIRRALQRLRPRSLAACVLLDKQQAAAGAPPDFVGFAVGPEFLVGYGLDHDQRWRHLPYVAVLR